MSTENLVGKQFGQWSVIERAENNKYGNSQWVCQCNCDAKTIQVILGYRLRNQSSVRCQLCANKLNSEYHTKHGGKGTRLYSIWKGIKSRCNNPNNQAYEYYGAKGVRVCDEWKESFETFKNWSVQNGYSDNLTIDRIDTNGNYEPSNCRWVSMEDQNKNKTSNVILTYNNESHTLSEWSQITGIHRKTIKSRIDRNGWSIERALTTPVKKQKGA